MEVIKDKEYDNFVSAMERLSSLPYAYKVKDFIMQYMTPLMHKSSSSEIPKVHHDEEGRAYITVYGNVFENHSHVLLSLVVFQNV